MSTGAGPIAAYRRFWLPELLTLTTLAAAASVVFAITDLDIASARWFYHPELADPWPVAGQRLWWLFYRSAPWVTGLLAVVGAAALIAGVVRKESRRFRLHGLFVLLCVVVGPGLIVNGVLKNHWGRPRPRQVIEFGGRLAYAPPLAPAGEHGKSFPCGHCSVGYLYAIGWWLWRRRRPRRAVASLAAGLVLGTLLGFGRIAAGGHFLSDVVWSGLIALGVAHALYYYVLRIPPREDARAAVFPMIERNPRLRAAAIIAAGLLGAGVIGGGILATPQYEDLTGGVRLTDYPAAPERLELLIDVADVEIQLVVEPRDVVAVSGYVHGFGLPTDDIQAAWEYEPSPTPTLRYRLAERGWFTDIDGIARVRVPVRNLREISVRVKRGDIAVADVTARDAREPHLLPRLDLQTAFGRVELPK